MNKELRKTNLSSLAWVKKPFQFIHKALLRTTVPLTSSLLGRPLRRYSVVTPHLWVSSQHYRRGLSYLKQHGVSAIVNLRRHDDAAKKRVLDSYLWLPTIDNTPPSLSDIQRAVDFIRTKIEQRKTVLIHCRAGVGRAPTIAACYLISTGLTPDAAWQKIRAARPFIFPNASQRQRVQEYYDQHYINA